MSPWSGIRAVVLDMGGVLLDMGGARGLPGGALERQGRRALLGRLAVEGGELSAGELEETLFAPWRAAYAERYETGREASWAPHLERLRRRTGVVLPDLELLAAWFRPFARAVHPVTGAREALEELARRRFRLGLVSNVPLPGYLYRRILETHGLLAPLETTHFSYDRGTRKPSPAMLRAVLGELGVVPQEAVMVGDRREADVASGRAAGARTVWIEGPHRNGPAADRTAASILALPPLLADPPQEEP